MGSCLSKKTPNASPLPHESAASVANSAPPPPPPPPPTDLNTNKGLAGKKMAATGQVDGEDCVKKEIFVIKHRKSHDKRAQDKSPESPQICNPISSITDGDGGSNAAVVNVITASASAAAVAAPIRTSSCSKEELDAILIQCGRLSRSSSGNGKAAAAASSGGGRKYSGSKRSYDFDHQCGNGNDDGGDDKKGAICAVDDDGDYIDNQKKGHHERRSRGSPSPHGRRRRTPSREREQQQQQRSGSSRERGAGGGGSGGSERRVSRSPAKRRSENASNGNGSSTSSTRSGRPGKIVSVPATVSSSSLVMDKSNNEPPANTNTTSASIKRVSVKRNVGDGGVTRGAASPRSQSPAKVANYSNVEVFNDNQDVPSSHQHQPSLSRSSSRKGTEQSPYRRRPLNEISSNSLVLPQHSNKTTNVLVSQAPMVKPNVEETNNTNCKVVAQGTGSNSRITSKSAQDNKVVAMAHRAKEDQHQNVVQQLKPNTSSVESMSVLVASGAESMNPPMLTRSRSSRLSRDLDLNPEALLNTTASASYAALLLEDIHNFHQKNSNNSSFSLPPCVTKACSILDAVADLNSCTSSDRLSSPLQLSSNANYDLSCGTNLRSAKNEYGASGDPFVESELAVCDDLMEPSLHKYVTLRRGTVVGGGDAEEIESSGSNSFMSGGQQQLWEPNSANSTDRSNTRELDVEKAPRRLSAKKKRDSEPQQTRIERSRVAASRVAAST